jgi:long-chain fatty acid transport protein
MTCRVLSVLSVSAALMLGCWSDALAQGYGSFEHSTCAAAMGGAAVADPCPDGSATWFNPAALADGVGSVFTVGSGFVSLGSDWTSDKTGIRTTMVSNWIPIPNLYYARPIGTHARFGFGLWSPYGLQTEWPEGFEGRFLSYLSKLQTIYFQPTVSYRVNDRLMVGGGVDVSFARVELRRRVDLSSLPIPGSPLTFRDLGVPPGTDFADLDMRGSSAQLGFNVGILVKVSGRASLGARYLSRQTVRSSAGEVKTRQIGTGLTTPAPLPGLPPGTPLDSLVASQFSAGQPLQSGQAISSQLPLPDLFVAGIMFRANSDWKFNVDYQFTNWSLFDFLIIKVKNGITDTSYQGYRDTHSLRVGSEYLWHGTALRGGFIAHSAAAPAETVTALLPEGSRLELTAGVGRQLTHRIGLDLAYQYLHQRPREGRVSNCGQERPTVECNSGVFRFGANAIGANLTFGW